jgi:hypothetical protein
LATRYAAARERRIELLAKGACPRLEDRSQAAADKLYHDTVLRLCEGLERVLQGYAHASDSRRIEAYKFWKDAADR